jgi:hypothetical protein
MNYNLFHTPPWWEIEERDRVLERLAEARADYLNQIRWYVAMLYSARLPLHGDDAYVTSDDARTFFENMPDVPPPDVLSRNFLGAVFKTAEWETDGTTVMSVTPGRHANRVFRWRRKENSPT